MPGHFEWRATPIFRFCQKISSAKLEDGLSLRVSWIHFEASLELVQ